MLLQKGWKGDTLSFMRCTGYCTAAGYDLARLQALLQMMGTTRLYRDVLHFQPKEEKPPRRHIFYFQYGVTVFWGFSLEEEVQILGNLRKVERDSLGKQEEDEFLFGYGETMGVRDDEITLPTKDALVKLSISFAIAQSVKLTVFEEAITRTVEHSKKIPKDLAEKGKIPLSRKEASRKMGEIFLERNYVNLHTEILDTPEFFWEHSELEPFYRRMILYLDVGKRVELLNRRLKLLHELFEILGTELNHQHSSRLEMTIIILIVIEVALAVLHDLLHWI